MLRIVLALALCGGLLAVGCSKGKSKRVQPPPPAALNTPKVTGKPIVTPIVGPLGKITSVNSAARFAVVSYATGPLPPVGRTLGVYRAGLKVGELKITPPAAVGLNVAGDIVAGDVRQGDEVREE